MTGGEPLTGGLQGTTPIVETLTGFEYTYQYKDHLGNIRLSYQDLDGNGAIDPTTEIKEENHYYPFGLKHKGYNNQIVGSKNNYKTYQGQEFTEDLDLNWHEWKYRFSDPAIARFISIDPLAEKYIYNSTYAFQENKLGLGVELEGLELSSVRSKDGKSVTLTYRVNPINNSSYLNNEMFRTLVDERKKQTKASFSGDMGDGISVSVEIIEDKNATISWEYTDSIEVSAEDEEKGIHGIALGYTDFTTEENYNTQENRTQISIPLHFDFDENGNIQFTEESIQEATKTGSHEDGHVGGLNHYGYTKSKKIRKQMKKDPNNLMLDTPTGTNVHRLQRKDMVEKVEKQQEGQ